MLRDIFYCGFYYGGNPEEYKYIIHFFDEPTIVTSGGLGSRLPFKQTYGGTLEIAQEKAEQFLETYPYENLYELPCKNK